MDIGAIATKPSVKKAKGGKKNRKYGRNLKKCAQYRSEGRREKNKARKAKKIAHIQEKREAKRASRGG